MWRKGTYRRFERSGRLLRLNTRFCAVMFERRPVLPAKLVEMPNWSKYVLWWQNPGDGRTCHVSASGRPRPYQPIRNQDDQRNWHQTLEEGRSGVQADLPQGIQKGTHRRGGAGDGPEDSQVLLYPWVWGVKVVSRAFPNISEGFGRFLWTSRMGFGPSDVFFGRELGSVRKLLIWKHSVVVLGIKINWRPDDFHFLLKMVQHHFNKASM